MVIDMHYIDYLFMGIGIVAFISLPIVFLWLGWRFPPNDKDESMKIYLSNEID
jgi:hypothetical protein